MKRLLLPLLLLLLPPTLTAQQQRTPLQRAQTYSWYVRALQGDSVVASGRVRAVTPDAIRIDTTRVQLSDVSALERRTRTGSGWKTGAIIGTAAMTFLFTGRARRHPAGRLHRRNGETRRTRVETHLAGRKLTMKRLMLIALIACASAPLQLAAQQPRAQLQRAQTYSWYVRASRGDSMVATGRVRALTADAVRIDTTNILFTDITRLERRIKTGGAWRRGAITGTIIMGALGILAGAEVCAYSETGDCDPLLAGVGFAAIGAAIGFPVGGMIGEVVRPGTHEWQTIWPASRN